MVTICHQVIAFAWCMPMRDPVKAGTGELPPVNRLFQGWARPGPRPSLTVPGPQAGSPLLLRAGRVGVPGPVDPDEAGKGVRALIGVLPFVGFCHSVLNDLRRRLARRRQPCSFAFQRSMGAPVNTPSEITCEVRHAPRF
jgi:hypothetical protein